MRVVVTGGAGCIGSEIALRLLREGNTVTVIDNLSSGKKEHMKEMKGDRFRFIKADITDIKKTTAALNGADAVFHLAANSDIKFKKGDRTDEDLRQNTIATYNVLEAMRTNGTKKIVFTSSSAVYGEAEKMPTPEEHMLEPISLYGASKAACETLISGFCHMFGMRGCILRLANVIGNKNRKTGETVLTDFINKLRKNSKELQILGNGGQSKSYLLVDDCVDGILAAFSKAKEKVSIYNLGPEDFISVNEIAAIVIEEMWLNNVNFTYTGGDRGWTGDVPKFLLDTTKIRKLGWKPSCTSKEAVRKSVRQQLKK